MQFNDTTNETGICQEIDRICVSSTTSYPLADKARRVNLGLDRFFYIALCNDGKWQFDDAEHSDLPIGITNLVSGQYDYEFADEILMVEKIMVKNPDGNWEELNRTNINESTYEAQNLYLQPTANTGTPTHYDKIGHSIFLQPKPNYNSTGGLKVVFKRNKHAVDAGDTTQEPGIPSLFHPYLCRYASLPYLYEKEKFNQAARIERQIQMDEEAIVKFFARRDRDDAKVMTFKKTNFR